MFNGSTKILEDRKSKVKEVVYCFWTGDNPITSNRRKCLATMKENLGVRVEFLDQKGIENKILKEAPLHPGYKYLSAVHKSDYLRCYFMHHFGGGYADLKAYSKDNTWEEGFKKINECEEIELIGCKEIIGGSPIEKFNVPEIINVLVSNGFFIARSHSFITTLWYKRMLDKMDEHYEALRKNPAPHPFARKGEMKSGGYPLRWAELLGEILHQVIYDVHIPFPYKTDISLESGWQKEIQYR